MPEEDEEEQYVPTKGYFKVFSLQAGTCITSSVGATLMVTVILYNFFAENRFATLSFQIIQYFFIYSYALMMFAGFALVSFASFLTIAKTLMIGYWINFGGFLYWILLSIVSYVPTNDVFTYVCVDNRCPETHWLYDTRWRNYGFKCPFGDSKTTETPDYLDTAATQMRSYYIGCENYSEWPLATSTILAIFWALFMIYGLYIYNAFKKELTGESLED